MRRVRPWLGKAADVLGALGVAQPAFRLFERWQSLAADGEDDPSLPPPYLRVLTAGSVEGRDYEYVGRHGAEEFISLAARHGRPFEAGVSVLDFGCGCGRVARYVIELTSPDLSGCDINPEVLRWCRDHLAGRFEVNRPSPPLSYGPASFDIIYALSVFTHLRDHSARIWLAELARVARPGALALLSFWDEHAEVAEPFRSSLQNAGFHLRRGGKEGSNLLTSFFTHDGFAQRAAPQWRRLESVRSVDAAGGQAIMVLQRI